MTLLSSALTYVERGFSVIPVRPDKTPYIKWEPYQKQRATADQIKVWWEKWPGAMIGIVTGSISGVCVVDVDTDAGLQAFSEYLTGAKMPTVRTPGGGWHFYFKAPEECPSNKAGMPEGVDFRGQGGYIIAPPSMNGTGKPYAWLEGLDLDTVQPATLPEPYKVFINSYAFGGGMGGEKKKSTREHMKAHKSTKYLLLVEGMTTYSMLQIAFSRDELS